MAKKNRGRNKGGFAALDDDDDDEEEVGGGTATFVAEENTPGTVTKKTPHSKVSSTTVDPWAAVGGESDRIRLNQQLLAASDPAAYGVQRDAALLRVKATINKYYKSSLDSFLSAGEDLRNAENKALAATARLKALEMDQFHLMYPAADLGKYIGATAHDSNAYYSAAAVGGTRKKRATRKKK